MKILIHSLRDGFPQTVHAEYNPKDLDVEFCDLTYLEQIVCDGTVEKFKNTLTFRGNLRSKVEHTCGRCLKQVEDPVNHPFDVVYDVQGKEELDTSEDLRETLILDHPIRFLCREECLGLCPRCGKDLNEGPCNCSN